MPIYEYECSECGKFEERQHFGDAPPAHCPNGHSGVRRRLSSPIIIYKGSGFYSTDHGKNGSAMPSSKKPESNEKSEGESKAEPKPEAEAKSKPEAKPEPAAEQSKNSTDSDS